MDGSRLTAIGSNAPIEWILAQLCPDEESRPSRLSAMQYPQRVPVLFQLCLSATGAFRAFIELQDGRTVSRSESPDLRTLRNNIEDLVLSLDSSERDFGGSVIHVVLPQSVAGFLIDDKLYSSVLVMPGLDTGVCLLTSRSNGEFLTGYVRNSTHLIVLSAPRSDEIVREFTQAVDLLIVSGVTHTLMSCLEGVALNVLMCSELFPAADEPFQVDETELVRSTVDRIQKDSSKINFGPLREVIARNLLSRATIDWMGCVSSISANVDPSDLFFTVTKYQHTVDDAPSFVLRFLDAVLFSGYDHGANDNYFSFFDGVIMSSVVLLALMQSINNGLSEDEFGPFPVKYDIREFHPVYDESETFVVNYFRQLVCEIVGHSSAVIRIDQSSSDCDENILESKLGQIVVTFPKGDPEITLIQLISNATSDIKIMSFSDQIHQWFLHDPVEQFKSILFTPVSLIKSLLESSLNITVFDDNPRTLFVLYDVDADVSGLPSHINNLCVLIRPPKADFVASCVSLAQRLQTIPIIVLPHRPEQLSTYRLTRLDSQSTDFVVPASTGLGNFIDFAVSIGENCRPGCEMTALTVPLRTPSSDIIGPSDICEKLRTPLVRSTQLCIKEIGIVAFPTYLRPFEYFKRRAPLCSVEKSVEMCLNAIHSKGRSFELSFLGIEASATSLH